jgi:uncharacterized protein YoxC
MAEKKTKTEELLEKISKNLEDINKGIETDKERQLLIDIAKLQADVQIWLAMCLGCVASCGGLLIGDYQLYITPVSSDMVFLKNAAFITLLVILLAFGGIAVFCANRMESYRQDMDNLKSS